MLSNGWVILHCIITTIESIETSIGHFRLTFDLVFKVSPAWCSTFTMQIGFHLHVKENLCSYERMSARTRFENEAKGNSEMANLIVIYPRFSVIHPLNDWETII